MNRPAHQRPGLVALVFLGGAAGTAARFGLAASVPTAAGWPTSTFVANLLGALLLGVLLEALVGSGPETARARRVRLALGTGVLGGFTTFSALAIELERLAAAGEGGLALTYGLVSVVGGFGCAVVGVRLGAHLRALRQVRAPAPAAGPEDAP